MMRRGLPALPILAGLCALPPGAAWGQSCTVSATALAFGAYQPLSGAAVTSSGTVTVTCNPGLVSALVSYTIAIGTGGGGSVAGRRMSGTGSALAYQLYTNAMNTQVWGDGTAGTSTVTDGYTLGVAVPITRNYACYGKIPASQPVDIGAYSDVLSVLLSY